MREKRPQNNFILLKSIKSAWTFLGLKSKNNHSNEISVFKLGKNEVLHKILGIFCQKLNIQYMADGSHLGFDPLDDLKF